MVLLPGADEDAAALRAEHLRAKVESIVVRYLEKNLPKITISIGVATFPASGDNPQAVLKAADEALYRAKERGRNRVELSGTESPNSGTSPEQPATAPRAPVAVDLPELGEVQSIGSLVDAAGRLD